MALESVPEFYTGGSTEKKMNLLGGYTINGGGLNNLKFNDANDTFILKHYLKLFGQTKMSLSTQLQQWYLFNIMLLNVRLEPCSLRCTA